LSPVGLLSDDHEAFKVLEGMEALGQALGNIVLTQPTQAQIVMEEDTYCMAANMGLEQAKTRLFAMDEDSLEVDFAETRLKVQDLLRGVAVALANGHQDNNVPLVKRVAGLLANVNWEAPVDEIKIDAAVLRPSPPRPPGGETSWEFLRSQVCETERGVREKGQRRFMCWKVRTSLEGQVPSSVEFMYVVSDGLMYYLQFDFPVTSEEAWGLSGLRSRAEATPMKVRRWKLTTNTMKSITPVRKFGSPCPDVHENLFKTDYRVYAKDNWLLAPLRGTRRKDGSFCRRWCLLDSARLVGFSSQRTPGSLFEPLFEAKPYLPASKKGLCEAGPDSRLAQALAALAKAPERVFANTLAHMRKARKPPHGEPHPAVGKEAPLLEAGLPFLVGNPSAPRRGDKKAAASILRMAVLGAPYGVRSFMDQPIGGEEISAACLGAACPRSVRVMENQTRRVRLGSSQKEITALWNKRATLKANTARLHRRGKVLGSALFDGRCRAFFGRRPCMGLVSTRTRRCLSCKKEHPLNVGGKKSLALLRKKRLLEDPGMLLLSKKMRQCRFPVENRFLLRGEGLWATDEVLSGNLDLRLAGAGSVQTLLPPGYRLSQDMEHARLYPEDLIIYCLDVAGTLRPSGRAHSQKLGSMASDATRHGLCLPKHASVSYVG
jgi:hypothetical protein